VISNRFKPLALILALFAIINLLVACGSEASATLTPALTTLATTNISNTTTALQTAATIATTAITPTTAAIIASTVATSPKPTPTIGNVYPSGPAPTAAMPAGGLVSVQLQIPEQLRKRSFTVSHTLNLPAGFSASLYALLDEGVRFMTLSPDGVVFVSEMGSGQVALLKDTNGVAERVSFTDGLDAPHGLAFHTSNGITYLYVAEMTRVVRFAYQPGQQRADKKETIVTGIPGGGNHRTRTVVFGKDGKMYLSVGSSCNVCEESDPRRGSVLQFNDDGTNGRIFSTGLRNGVGLVVNPFTGELWETENGRDIIGDNIPPEEINILVDGGNYGWPYCYSNGVWDSNFGKRDQAFCNTTTKPVLPMQAHSAPLGIDIYTGKQFPSEYVGDAFVGFHGSWNRNEKTGYKVVRLRVKDGRPVSYEDFATGWLVNGQIWGRPVMPMMTADGSLLVSDDLANAVYRISYTGR